jgi:hypothetical protein
MIAFVCSLIAAAWLITGPIWRLVHYFPLAFGLSSVVYLVWRSAMSERRITSRATANVLSGSKLRLTLERNLTALRTWFSNVGRGSGNKGWAKYAPILFSLFCVVGLVYGLSRQSAYQVSTEHDIAVVGIHGPYRFTFQHVDSEGELYGDSFTEDICKDFVSPEKDFPLGIILNKVIHTDEGNCWSLNPDKHAGYFKRRDADRNPMFVARVQ